MCIPRVPYHSVNIILTKKKIHTFVLLDTTSRNINLPRNGSEEERVRKRRRRSGGVG